MSESLAENDSDAPWLTRLPWVPPLTLEQSSRISVSVPPATERSTSVLLHAHLNAHHSQADEGPSPLVTRRLTYRKEWARQDVLSGAVVQDGDPPGPPVVYYDALREYQADNDRAWHIDWMRFVANWLVVAVHMITTTDDLRLWSTAPEAQTMRSFLVNLLQIGMPIFFYASGRAAAYSSDRNWLNFALKKTRRLMIPLAVGYFVIVASAAFISEPFYTCRNTDTPDGKPGQFFHFYAWFVKNFGGCGFEWLWFLPTLWSLSIGCFPFQLFVSTYQVLMSPGYCLSDRDRATKAALYNLYAPEGPQGENNEYTARQRWKALRRTAFFAGGYSLFIIIVLWLFCNQIMGAPALHCAMYALPFFFAGLMPCLIAPYCRKLNIRVFYFIWLPIGTLVMAYFKEDTVMALAHHGFLDIFIARQGVSMAFYGAFYLQGFIEQRYMYEWEKYERLAMNCNGRLVMNYIFRPFKVVIWVALTANGVPGLSAYWAYLWTYPVYNETYSSVSYVVGSWIGLHMWERFMMMYCRSSFHPRYHKHITQSSMVVYVTHGLSLAIVGRLLLWPLRSHIRKINGVVILSALVVPMTVFIYFIIISVPPLAAAFGLEGGKYWSCKHWCGPFKRFRAAKAAKRAQDAHRINVAPPALSTIVDDQSEASSHATAIAIHETNDIGQPKT